MGSGGGGRGKGLEMRMERGGWIRWRDVGSWEFRMRYSCPFYSIGSTLQGFEHGHSGKREFSGVCAFADSMLKISERLLCS